MSRSSRINFGGRTTPRGTTRKPPVLALDEGLLELPGDKPLWIWAHTCPDRACDCRTALILVSDESREALLTRALPVREAWQAESGYIAAASKHAEFTPFLLDIDAVTVADLAGEQLFSLDAHPQIAEVLRRLNGEALDTLARLWHVGKAYPDQRELVLAVPSVTMPNWRPGLLTSYGDVFRWVRGDLYFLDPQFEFAFEAEDAYCINPACACGEVSLIFYGTEGHPIGAVEVGLSGTLRMDPEPAQGETLDRLWTAFRQRHPNYLARFSQRNADMKIIGQKTVEVNPRPKIGRNDPCPCGSGKKFKKCCGAAEG